MTSAEDGIPRQPAGFLLPYAEILRIPRAWQFSVAGIIGRMPMSMVGLGIVLLISASTGRYAVAGSVSAASSLGMAACAAQFGARRPLRPGTGDRPDGYRLRGRHRGPYPRHPAWRTIVDVLPPAVVAGAAMPALGPMSRARWSALLAGSPRLHTAFSLESVADRAVFVIGPASVTVLATQVHPFGRHLRRCRALPRRHPLVRVPAGETEPVAAARGSHPERLGSGRVFALRARLPHPPSRSSCRSTCSSAPCSSRSTSARWRSRRTSGTRTSQLHPGHVCVRQRDGRAVVRRADLEGTPRAASRRHADAHRRRGLHVLGDARPGRVNSSSCAG